jgi:hypothetical protein
LPRETKAARSHLKGLYSCEKRYIQLPKPPQSCQTNMYSHPSKSSRLLPLDVPPPPHHPTSSATALSFSPHGSGFSSQGQHFGHHYGIPEDDASPPGIYFGQTPIGSYFNTPDGGQSQHAGSKPRRRRSQSGIEGVKHRRTRSGCFTCRTRRVKVGQCIYVIHSGARADELWQKVRRNSSYLRT